VRGESSKREPAALQIGVDGVGVGVDGVADFGARIYII
jgi:hypothetical protein